MKNFTNGLLLIAAVALFSCKDDKKEDPGTTVTGEKTATLSSNITSSRTLYADTAYTLKGNVFVSNGATLTIQPGTKIFGDKASKGGLIVSRGAKLMAVGTATNPIVFTSSAPAGYRNRGDWGGVILLGRAQNNQSAEQPIEGIEASSNSSYGGTTNDDNSGTLKYVRIEFAGIALSPNNEVNGLTMGSVGSGTTIDHIQVSYSNDDSFEWFGGTVNCNHLVAYKGLDDDFDTDFGFSGNVSYGIGLRDPLTADVSASNGFESDNDAAGSSNAPKTSATFDHFTLVGPYAYKPLKAGANKDINANYKNGAHIRRNTDIKIKNTIIVGFPNGINYDKTGSAAELEKVVIAQNALSDLAGRQTFSLASSPAPVIAKNDTVQVADMNKVFGGTSWNNIDAPDLSNVTAPYNTSGAHSGTPDWNWNSGWLNFDPVNTDYSKK